LWHVGMIYTKRPLWSLDVGTTAPKDGLSLYESRTCWHDISADFTPIPRHLSRPLRPYISFFSNIAKGALIYFYIITINKNTAH
jgi:hypothetical protein